MRREALTFLHEKMISHIEIGVGEGTRDRVQRMLTALVVVIRVVATRGSLVELSTQQSLPQAFFYLQKLT